MVKIGPKLPKMVQNGPKLSKIFENVQNSPVLDEFSYIQLYQNIFGHIFYLPKYSLNFSKANLFIYSFMIEFFRRISSDIHLSNNHDQNYIHYSFVSKNDIHHTHCEQPQGCKNMIPV